MLTVHCVMFVVFWLLLDACCLRFGVRLLLSVGGCVLLDACCVVHVMCCLLFVVLLVVR